LWIDPAPLGIDRVVYQMIANSLGHAGYGTQTRGKGAEDLNWAGNWKQASSQTDGFWDFECAIPIASMSQAGAGRQSTDGTWLINLCRNWRRHWMASSFTGGRYVWYGLTFRFTSGPVPVVRQIIDGDPSYPQDGAALRLQVNNPSAAPMSLNASLALVRNNMPELKQQQTIELAAGQEQTIEIRLDANDPTTISDLKVSVSSLDGKQVYFDRSLHWTKSATPNRWGTDKPQEAPP